MLHCRCGSCRCGQASLSGRRTRHLAVVTDRYFAVRLQFVFAAKRCDVRDFTGILWRGRTRICTVRSFVTVAVLVIGTATSAQRRFLFGRITGRTYRSAGKASFALCTPLAATLPAAQHDFFLFLFACQFQCVRFVGILGEERVKVIATHAVVSTAGVQFVCLRIVNFTNVNSHVHVQIRIGIFVLDTATVGRCCRQ